MKITISQINTSIGDFRGNINKIISCIKKIHDKNSDLIIFPEMCLSGYPPQDLLKRNDFINENMNALQKLVKTSQTFSNLAIIAGTILPTEKSFGNKLYNSAVLINNGKILFTQHKSLLPTYDVFDEARYFKPADELNVFKYKGEILGISICEDAWQADPVFKNTKYNLDPINILNKKGATIFINISASPFCIGKEKIRHKIFKDHVKKFKKPFVFVNQVGANDELISDGRSMIFNKNADLIELSPPFSEHLQTIDLNKNTNKIIFKPQNEIESICDALILGIRDYLAKCSFKKVIIGLSGGIDSAVTCVLAVNAIGKNNVMGILMPSPISSQHSIDDSLYLASNLDIETKTIPIKNIYNSYTKTLEHIFKNTKKDITEENIQARIRGNILMALANKFAFLTLSTGNKSELAVGYCTLYGDMSGGLSVLADVSKTTVYKLASYINRNKKIIPQNIIDKPPSAELKPDQKDEDTLPPYPLLDRILELYLDKNRSIDEIIQSGIDKKVVKWIIDKIKNNEYKRRQAALGLKITAKAFGTGRRMPIASKNSF